MDNPESIDLAAWPRREHFYFFRTYYPAIHTINVDVDVTDLRSALRRAGRRAYPAQVWALSTVVNRHEEFRMTLDSDGNPAIWPVVHPGFTIFHQERETFSALWTPYDADFGRFHDQMVALLDEHRGATTYFPQGPPPPCVFGISPIPWVSFNSFTLQTKDNWDHMLPIISLGRYAERDDRTFLPVTVQINHAAADGFHTARLVNELSELVAKPDWIG